jgi:hypothetical protein
MRIFAESRRQRADDRHRQLFWIAGGGFCRRYRSIFVALFDRQF